MPAPSPVWDYTEGLMVLIRGCALEPLKGLLNHRSLSPTACGMGPQIFIPTKFPENTGAAHLGTPLWEPLVQENPMKHSSLKLQWNHILWAWLVVWGMDWKFWYSSQRVGCLQNPQGPDTTLWGDFRVCLSPLSLGRLLWQGPSFSYWLEDSRNMSLDSMTKKIRSRENFFLFFLLRSGFPVFISSFGNLLSSGSLMI